MIETIYYYSFTRNNIIENKNRNKYSDFFVLLLLIHEKQYNENKDKKNKYSIFCTTITYLQIII